MFTLFHYITHDKFGFWLQCELPPALFSWIFYIKAIKIWITSVAVTNILNKIESS